MFNNNTSPKVSIIMPTYNRAAFIVETIESIINQTYQNWELTIIDDKSDDNTKELIEAIKDERIKYYKSEKKVGITIARNIGLDKIKNELVAFMDSDDLWVETKLEKQVQALEEYPDAKFCLTGGFNFRRSGDNCIPYPGEVVDYFYKQNSGIKVGQLLTLFFQSGLSTTTPSLMFQRTCLETTGILNENKTYADVDFILGLAKNFQGIILYESLLYRRLHESNTSNAEWEKGYEEGISLILAYKNSIPANVTKHALFNLYINSGEDYLIRKMNGKAIGSFFKAWKNKPFSFIPAKKTMKTVLKYLRIKK